MSKQLIENKLASESLDLDQMLELFKAAETLSDVDNVEAISLAEQSLQIAIHLNNKEYQFECYYLIGQRLISLGEYDKAMDKVSIALDIVREYFPHNKKMLTLTTNSKGIICYCKGNFELALDFFLRALQFDYAKEILRVYNNLAITYTITEKHEEAYKYIDLGLRESRKRGNLFMVTALLLNSTLTLIHLNRSDDAKKNAIEALEIANDHVEEDAQFYKLKIGALQGLGDIYIRESSFEKALDSVDEALKISEEKSFTASCSIALKMKAEIYLKRGDEKEGIDYVQRSLVYMEKHQITNEKSGILKLAVNFYEEKGDLLKAYPYLKELEKQSDDQATQSRDENFKKILTEREKEIHLLEGKNNEIQEQNLLLEQFAHIIAHDLKEPLRNLVSFSSLLVHKFNNELGEEASEYLKYIKKGAMTMNQNLIRLLDFTTLKRVEEEEVQKININEIVNKLANEYEGAIEPFKIRISCPDNQLNMVYSHAYALLDEIICNAIKFREKGADCYIEIENNLENDYQHITIKDYGIGIEKEYQRQIFKIFNRLNKRDYDGSGVGLAICKRITKLYKGDIWINSVHEKYTIVHCKISTKM